MVDTDTDSNTDSEFDIDEQVRKTFGNQIPSVYTERVKLC